MRGERDRFRRAAKEWGTVVFSVAFIGMACAQERLPNEPLLLKPGIWTVAQGPESKLLATVKFWTSFPLEMETKEMQTLMRPGKETPVGIHFLRAFTGDNVTPWQAVIVDDLALVARKERDNETPAKAFELKGAAILTGTIQAIRSEFYKVKLAKGENVTIEVLAQRLLSKLDPHLRVLDEQGRQLAFSEDEPGLGKDSRLHYVAKTEQTVILEVRDSLYQGGDQHVYALRVGDFPRVNFGYAGSNREMIWFGPDAEGVTGGDKNGQPGIVQWFAPRQTGNKPAALVTTPMEVDDILSEMEPNDQQAKANPVPTSANVFGRFERVGDVDWFAWEAKKGERFFVRAQTRSIGLPTDVKLSAHGADAKELAASKVASEDEGGLEVTAGEDGKLSLRVRHIASLSGPEQGYRLSIQPARTAFSLKTETDKLIVAQGDTADLKVAVDRAAYEGAIEFKLDPKVEGLTLVKGSIEAKKKEGTLQIKAASDMAPGSIHQVRVLSVNPPMGRVQTYHTLTNQWGPSATMAATLDGWITVAIKAKTGTPEKADKP